MIEWSLSDGTIIGNNNVIEVDLPPGPHIIRLRAIDSRGLSNMTAVSIMVGSSAPTISSLQISPSVLIAGTAQRFTSPPLWLTWTVLQMKSQRS